MEVEMTDWDQYLVPIYDLDHGEFTHKVPIDFSLSRGKDRDKYSKQIKPFMGILSAYTNTSGGCILLQNQPNAHDLVPENIYDKWRNDIKDQFDPFLPDVLRYQIRFEYRKGEPCVYVKPSINIVSLHTHLVIRQFASKRVIGLQESVTRCMNQDWKAHTELPTNKSYKYQEKLPYSEDDHIEFKHFKRACSAEDLLDIINETEKYTIGLTLFGMVNLQGGGTVFVGVNDSGEALGQPLDEPEEQTLREGLVNFFKENQDGEKRICNTQDFDPKDGKDFKIEFIEVGVRKKPKINCDKSGCKCYNKRRVLIKISVYQSKGVLLMQHPECYKVKDDSKIIKMSLDEWYKRHKQAQPALSHHQIQGGSLKSTGRTAASSSAAVQKPLVSTQNASPPSQKEDKSAVASGHQSETPASLDQEKSLLAYNNLSFKRDSSLCNPQPAADITPKNIARAARDYEIFKMKQPCNFNPQCEALLIRYPSIKEKLDIIKKEIGDNTNSFALVESSLFSCFNHELKASDFPSGRPLKSPPDVKPEHHMLDILAADDTGMKHIFCLFEGDGTHHDQEKSYGLHLVRVMKKRMTEEMKKQKCERSEVHIKLTILHMECDDLKVFESSASEKLPPAADDMEIEMMKIAMASIFLAKESIFKTRMKSDMTIQFSSQQAETLLGLGFVPITIITGGPGTGKSLLAQFLFEKWGKDKSVYVCSTRPLEKFVQSGGKAETFLIQTNERLPNVMRDLLVNKSCIALEESHMIGCEREVWKAIFEVIRCSPKKCSLIIFRDSEFQDYLNQHSNFELTTAIEEYRKKYTTGIVHEKVLTEVFRNSQIIGSYMYAIQDEPPNHLTFRSTMHGDDVTMLVILNLRVKSKENGLLLHLKKIFQTGTIDTVDVAILVHDSDEKNLFLDIFEKFWPGIIVHGADIFPPGGIVLETVTNFTGLEAPFIIYIVPLEKDDICLLDNIKYKCAIVSRAINRVEFLQDEVVDHQEAVNMKFDRPPTAGQHVIKKQPSKPLSTSEKSTLEEFKFVRELQDMEVMLNEDTVFECEVNRKDIPVSWYINDKAVEAGTQYQIFIEDTVHKLSIKKAKRQNEGEIKCVFKKAVTTAKLSVRESGLKWRKEGYEDIRSLAVMTDGSSLVITAEGKTKNPDGTVTFSSSTLQRLSAQGEPLDLPFPYYATKPRAICVDNTTSTVVLVEYIGSDDFKVYVYSHHSDSWLCRSFSTRRNIQQAAVTDDGYIVCAVMSGIQETLVLMSITGQEQWSTPLPGGRYRTYLCVSKQLIIVSSMNNDTVTVFSRQGDVLRTLSRELIRAPTGVTCDSAGRVVIADEASESISLLTPEGDFIKTLVKCQQSPSYIGLSQDTLLLVAEYNYDTKSFNLCMHELQ